MVGAGSGERLTVPRPVPTLAEMEEWWARVEGMVEEMFGPDAPDAHYWKHVEQFKGRKEVNA
jgi:hypothetical protein